MKFGKKSTAMIAFTLGATIFISTALADTIIGSGYSNFKDAIKNTAEIMTSGELSSYEVTMNIALKVDDITYMENINHTKYEFAGNKREQRSTSYEFGERFDYYFYTDSSRSISKNSRDDKYYVREYRGGNRYNSVNENPFEHDKASDAEKIIDAFIGNLAELVQVEEYGGKKMFTGSISEAQIPTLANAFASYILKYQIARQHDSSGYNTTKSMEMPVPASNLFIQSVSGKAIQNELGAIESLVAEASASAVDRSGVNRIYTMEISFQMTGINSTVVREPNLDGADVDYSIEYLTEDGYAALSEKLIGLYSSDIVEEADGRWIKTGEKWIAVSSVSGNVITARLYEFDSEGNEVYSQNILARQGDENNRWNYIFDYTDKNGEVKQGFISHSDGIDLQLSFGITMYERGGYSYEEWASYRRFFE